MLQILANSMSDSELAAVQLRTFAQMDDRRKLTKIRKCLDPNLDTEGLMVLRVWNWFIENLSNNFLNLFILNANQVCIEIKQLSNRRNNIDYFGPNSIFDCKSRDSAENCWKRESTHV